MILEFAERKEEGDLKKLFVMGCLSERYLKELAVEIPQVDKFMGSLIGRSFYRTWERSITMNYISNGH